MKAIITRQNADGTYDEVGINNRMLRSEYKSIKSLLRYGIGEQFANRMIWIEVFFTNIYQDKPDRTVFTTVYK